MKKLLFAAVSALVVAGGVQAGDSTEFGVLRVPSSAVETIVAVPWLASGTGSAAVKVADLVLTTGLNEGDELKYYNGSSYDCWQLQLVDGVKKWVPSTSVTVSGMTTGAGDKDAELACGRAIILKRKGENLTGEFYIMGKPTSDDGEVELLANGYTLIAPPFVTDTDVNTQLTWTNIENGKDQLLVPTDTGFMNLSYIPAKGGWCKRVGKAWSSVSVTIPAGKGAWFTSSGAKNSGKKVSWQ